MGITHVVRTNCHTFDPLFESLTSAKNPCFYQKIVTQSPVFPHCPKFWKLFTQRPQIGWKKGTQNAPIFMAFVTERPPIFCLACKCLRGMLLPQTRSEAGNFVFLRQNRAIWWILLSANLIKVMKTKFQFYRLNRPNCYGRTSLEGRDDTQVIIPWSNMEGDISYNHPLYDSAPPGSLNKCQVYLKLWEQRHFKCKVQCRAHWRAQENFEI